MWPFLSLTKFLSRTRMFEQGLCDRAGVHRCMRYQIVLGSTLYVGLARAVPPTNKNFQITFYSPDFRRLSMETYLPV